MKHLYPVDAHKIQNLYRKGSNINGQIVFQIVFMANLRNNNNNQHAFINDINIIVSAKVAGIFYNCHNIFGALLC